MRLRLALSIALLAMAWTSALAQSDKGAAVPNLSGTWAQDFRKPLGEALQPSISISDPMGKKRGREDDIPYQPWALEKTMSERSASDQFGNGSTDPWINYCEPPGLLRIYMQPGRTRFVQTPGVVYILHEVMQTFRVVRLNGNHPDDPDPTWWGDSIGHYENGDTLVVDTIGVNDKTWLDQFGHPHTEKMHLIERYRRMDADSLDLDATIDDPGAYTRPFRTHRIFRISNVPFMQNPWGCSLRENQQFYGNVAAPAATAPPR